MAHKDCPTKTDIGHQASVYHTRRRAQHQTGHDHQTKYHAQVLRGPGDTLHIWYTDKLHPHSQRPDFPLGNPMHLLHAPHAPDSAIWAHLKNRPQLARLLAGLIKRMERGPWPS